MTRNHVLQMFMLVFSAFTFTACSNGGSLTLEPGAVKSNTPSTGSPFVNINLGGKAMIVQSGQTPTTGVHGWLTIQSLSSKTLTSTEGVSLVVNHHQISKQ